MQEATVIIPNLNGKHYLEECLTSLREQTSKDFVTILVDNGSSDGSVEYVQKYFPEVRIHRFEVNTGFCGAVNQGIRMSETPYVILLNNDTVCHEKFVESLLRGIRSRPGIFSCQARMLQMHAPHLIDDAGDYYCALGWAFAAGKGREAVDYSQEKEIFASCAGAAIYNCRMLKEIGLFDEKHFAYLEDIDIGYRARIRGYHNWYIPSAVVYHAGSGTSGSVYNEFKVRHASRNSVYLVYKNMPIPQIILNLPFLLVGFGVKTLFFVKQGFGKQYLSGLFQGMKMWKRENKVVFQRENLKNYVRIQCELWVNVVRRLWESS